MRMMLICSIYLSLAKLSNALKSIRDIQVNINLLHYDDVIVFISCAKELEPSIKTKLREWNYMYYASTKD